MHRLHSATGNLRGISARTLLSLPIRPASKPARASSEYISNPARARCENCYRPCFQCPLSSPQCAIFVPCSRCAVFLYELFPAARYGSRVAAAAADRTLSVVVGRCRRDLLRLVNNRHDCCNSQLSSTCAHSSCIYFAER